MKRTIRQQLRRSLADAAMDFDDLRRLYGLPVKALEEHLRHLEASLRSQSARLEVTLRSCPDCGFVPKRKRGRYAGPSRCPRCRRESLPSPLLEVAEG